MPDVAMSHYVALSEFALQLPSMLDKRQWVQSHRCRPDSELVPMFHFALTPTYSDARYVRFFRWLCRELEIDRRFEAGQD